MPTGNDNKFDALLEAFELFCEKTSSLEVSYRDLKEEQKNLNIELEGTNRILFQKNEELQQLNFFLKTLVTSMVQALLFIDKTGTIRLVNQAMRRLLHREESELVDRPYIDIIPDTLFGFSLREAFEKGGTDHSFKMKTFDEKIIETEASLLHNGLFSGLLLLARDTTELRKKEEMEAQQERLQELGQMAAQVAHEIRNPLGGIKGFAGLLQRDLLDKPDLQKMAQSITDAADQMNLLVTQVLTYARPVEPHFEKVLFLPLLQEIRELIEIDSNFLEKPTIEISVYPETLSASLDRTLIKSSLLNLAVNAVQAMEKGGTLTIQVKEELHFLVIEVKDTGVGIAPDLHKKIFSPFYTTKPTGSGLGLAEVMKNVRIHGGSIEVKSEVEKGTLFRIQIPQKGPL